jgi:2'-5' RNA ligase
VALDLPEQARDELVGWRERVLAARSDLRLVAPEALHVTLVFIGHRPETEVEAIAETVERSVTGLSAARLRATAVKPVPRRRPRLFALDLEDDGGRAASVQAAVAGALEADGVREPERRPFWPHVTLARVRRGAGAVPLEGEPPPSRAFEACEVTLYRSRLSPKGARYEQITRTRLDG